MEYANKVCEEKIKALDNSKELCTCPICEGREHVVYTGTNRGRRKFKCTNSSSHEKPRCFTTSTSFEAIMYYQDAMTENLADLLQTNSVIDGIRRMNETSRHFVELPLERLYQYIVEEGSKDSIIVDENTDIVTIFSDLTGSGLMKGKAIILAMVDDVPVFEIVTTDNYLSTMTLIAAIKKRLTVPDDTLIVFVTDGESAFVEPIKSYFPNAIHIRQFHKKSCRGMIYAHLVHNCTAYTIRCFWDVVLEEGTPSDNVLRQRERRAKKRKSNNRISKKDEYTELSKDVVIWAGTVFTPRGIRRRKPYKTTVKKSEKKNTSTHDAVRNDPCEKVFEGPVEDAKNIPVFSHCFEVMKKIFGGLHITSNVVENVFNIKSKLKEHRTMKCGDRILVSTLYGNLVLKDMGKRELVEFLKNRVVTKDFIVSKVLYGSGLQKYKPDKPSYEERVRTAIENGLQLVIHYCDRQRRHTSRVISLMNLEKSSYDNVIRLTAYCHLRDDERTFLLERIRDMALFDPNPYCFIANPG